jgi:hypothetical protein
VWSLGVGLLQHRDEVSGAEIAGGEQRGVELRRGSRRCAADERGLGDFGEGFDDVVDLRGEAAERERDRSGCCGT